MRMITVGHRQRWLECDDCGQRHASVRSGVHLARGLVFLFCLACRLKKAGSL